MTRDELRLYMIALLDAAHDITDSDGAIENNTQLLCRLLGVQVGVVGDPLVHDVSNGLVEPLLEFIANRNADAFPGGVATEAQTMMMLDLLVAAMSYGRAAERLHQLGAPS